ncbi:MAG: glycosyltransferase [Erythrobacter sp.]
MLDGISFLMPTFNRASYIAEALDSILCQIRETDEIIVIDDGSTDNTREILGSYNDRVSYHHQDNAGKSVALNAAMKMSRGTYIWIVDDDDIMLPGVVERLRTAISGDSRGVVFGNYRRFEIVGNVKRTMDRGYWPDLSQGSILRHLLEDHFIFHNAALVKREAYEAAGEFDTSLLRSQDYDMFIRLALITDFKYVDCCIFEQRKHLGQRGPAKIKHTESSSEKVWNQFDQAIFSKVRKIVPLAIYFDMFESADNSLVERAGLLQRACVMARHGLWSEALDDLECAVEIASSTHLSVTERRICASFLNGKYGFASTFEPATVRRLHAVFSGSPVGPQVHGSMANGLVWQLRKGTAERRREAWRFLTAFGRARSATRIVSERVRKSIVKIDESVKETQSHEAAGSFAFPNS